MGCISSKSLRSESLSHDDFSVWKSTRRSRPDRMAVSGPVHGTLHKIREETEWDVEDEESVKRRHQRSYSGSLRALKKGASAISSPFCIRVGRSTEGENVAAGWPTWLSAVAGEAIHGWLPLRLDKFERLEKIGQGTYSEVYRARDLETGKLVALKKVRFDNLRPESVRFMAREILILRKLNHPNVMKLEGIIASQMSSSIYLVFEYMEHDLAGMLSCPDIKFTDSQIKCYMLQLLRGIEHCHSHGVMHRDIKTSNILVNNEGVLKIGDFGLANFIRPKSKQPMTSRVVTLWYRPPELLLGSTSYGEAVDLWSIGCVFVELFVRRAILKGRTEVEQMHKIFKLCGSPSDKYWSNCTLPLATMFRPQHPYESSLRERCKGFPESAVNLIETFLSFEPYKRGTATLALHSEYFKTKPYACDSSSLPKYPPSKEIDAKYRNTRRKKVGSTLRANTGARSSRRGSKVLPESNEFFKVSPTKDVIPNIRVGGRSYMRRASEYKRRIHTESLTALNQRYETMSEASQTTQESHVSTTLSVPVQVLASGFVSQISTTLSVPVQVSASGFAWAIRQKQHNVIRNIQSRLSSRSHDSTTLDLSLEQVQPDSSDIYEPEELSRDNFLNRKKKGRVGFSAPLVQPSQEMAPTQIDDSTTLDSSLEQLQPDSSDIYVPEELTRDNFLSRKKKGRVGFLAPLVQPSQEMAPTQIDDSTTLDSSLEQLQPDLSDIYVPEELTRDNFLSRKKKGRVGFSAPLVQPSQEMAPTQIDDSTTLDSSLEQLQPDSSDIYVPEELTRDNFLSRKKKGRVGFSAPLVQPSQETAPTQIAQPRENHRSRFHKG